MASPTMADIADELGLSVSTVSRAINGTKVRESTRRAVLDYAARSGYQSSSQRDTDSMKPTKYVIGALLTNISDYYFNSLLSGVFSYCNAAGYSAWVSDLDGSLDAASVVGELCSQCDGLILIAPSMDDDAIRDLFDPASTILVSRTLEGFSSALVDERSGMFQAVRHLASLGHQRIAYLSCIGHSFTNNRRLESFREASSTFGLDSVVLGPFEPSRTGGINAADAILLEEGITGVIAFNDLMTVGALGRLQERGVSVPSEISMIGVDNSALGQALYPALTSVDVRHDLLGATAAQMLIRLLSGAEPAGSQAMLIPGTLIIRQSSGLVLAQ